MDVRDVIRRFKAGEWFRTSVPAART